MTPRMQYSAKKLKKGKERFYRYSGPPPAMQY